MIDNYLLEELVAFKKYGTLAAAADQLGLSQPALTRGMKKLETELEVQLFNRGANRITLTKAGVFAAERAEDVLSVNRSYVSDIQRFDKSQRELTICSAAPRPLIVLDSLKLPNISVEEKLAERPNWIELLLKEQYSCVVTNYSLKDKRIDSVYLGKERLTVNLSGFTDLASQGSVTFEQLSDLTFLVLRDIGIWTDVIQGKIPNAKFLYQDNHENFEEIKNYSVFPFFTTNVSKLDPCLHKELVNDRVPIKIEDDIAEMTFYASFLKSNRSRLEPVIEAWQDGWIRID